MYGLKPGLRLRLDLTQLPVLAPSLANTLRAHDTYVTPSSLAPLGLGVHGPLGLAGRRRAGSRRRRGDTNVGRLMLFDYPQLSDLTPLFGRTRTLLLLLKHFCGITHLSLLRRLGHPPLLGLALKRRQQLPDRQPEEGQVQVMEVSDVLKAWIINRVGYELSIDRG